MNTTSQNVKSEVTVLTDADFEQTVLQSNKPVLVDFWADWCQPCHMIAPTVKELAEEYGDRILVGKLDVDTNPVTTAKYNIRGIPALLLFKDGQLVDQITGVKSKEEIAQSIENNL